LTGLIKALSSFSLVEIGDISVGVAGRSSCFGVEGRTEVALPVVGEAVADPEEKAAERSKGSLWELLRRKSDLRGLWCCWRCAGGRFAAPALAVVAVEGASLKVTLGAASLDGRVGRSLSEVDALRVSSWSLEETSEFRTPFDSRLEEVEVRAGKVKWLSAVVDRSVVRERDCTEGRRPRALGGRGVVVPPPTRGV
jgi:hypothetical protein